LQPLVGLALQLQQFRHTPQRRSGAWFGRCVDFAADVVNAVDVVAAIVPAGYVAL
jgi:hypothetical protein